MSGRIFAKFDIAPKAQLSPKHFETCSVQYGYRTLQIVYLRFVISLAGQSINGLCDVILRSEEKTSDLAAHFSRNSGAANTVLFTIQTFNEHSRMAKLSQPYLRGHMR